MGRDSTKAEQFATQEIMLHTALPVVTTVVSLVCMQGFQDHKFHPFGQFSLAFPIPEGATKTHPESDIE